MRARFDRSYIEDELRRIGEQLDGHVNGYLIGGGALAFRDLKDTTKDIDIVFPNGDAFKSCYDGLTDCGYSVVRRPGRDYERLGPQRILENREGCRFDMFNQQVVDRLILSRGMIERSTELLESQQLTIHLVSAEDIFLFKAIAGRVDDIEDMFVLVQTGLDFTDIETELERQIDLLGQELFVSYMNEALIELNERHNVTTPLDERVASITRRLYRELEVLHAIEEAETREGLIKAVDLSAEDIEVAIDNLADKGAVAIDDGTITKQSSTL